MTETLDILNRVKVGLVVIGRNEGERLARCLASVREIPNRIYVDSGSTDRSVALAQTEGVLVVELPVPPNFTAARARNAGLAQLLAQVPDLEYVQMIDGDCELRAGWMQAATAALHSAPDVALVFGRLRERHPDRSIYNALCDDEWDAPIGDVSNIGGIALFRVAALREVNFYNSAMIAGEDSELGMRLIKCGWRLRRIDGEMALHDAALTRFGQWWNRTRRSGHCFGEMAHLHPDARDPNWSRSARSIMVWGGVMPALLLAAIALALETTSRWWFVAVLALVPWLFQIAQIARRQRQRGLSAKLARASGLLLMFGKLPQFQGLIGYYRNRVLGRASRLIEHKRAEPT